MARKFRTRRKRRQHKQQLKYGREAAPRHRLRGGRTGNVHSKRTPAKNNHKSGGTVVDTTLKRTKKEIEDLDSQAIEAMEHGSKYPGMSYEEGIRAALDWLFDRDQPHPFED